MRIKKGDMVKILSGKDRGKRGKVLRVLPKQRQVVVEGVNIKKKHRRSRRQDRKGEIVLLPLPLSVSAVQFVCPLCSKPARIGHRRAESGDTLRVCKRCKGDII